MTEHSGLTARNAQDWAAINDLALGFEDGVVREALIEAGDHVSPDGTLHYGGYPRVVVHVQTQGAGGRAVRLEFKGVRTFSYDYGCEASPALVTDVTEGLWEARLLALKITAEECYAILVDSGGLGEGPFILRG
jgi:hypothetical protein